MKTYSHLKTRIKALEQEYRQLLHTPNRSLQMMLRMEQIEKMLPYVSTTLNVNSNSNL